MPAWAQGWTRSHLELEDYFLSNEESIVLSKIVDTILPPGEKEMGGLKVGVDQFLLKLFDRCYEKEVQENIIHQLNVLMEKSKRLYGRDFGDCSQAERSNLLLLCAESEDEQEREFFELIKSESIRGFRTSREVMTRYYKYRVAPGHYHGCVDLDT